MGEQGSERLKDLTIKPSLACIANRPGCAARRDLHRAVCRIAAHDVNRESDALAALGLYLELPAQ